MRRLQDEMSPAGLRRPLASANISDRLKPWTLTSCPLRLGVSGFELQEEFRQKDLGQKYDGRRKNHAKAPRRKEVISSSVVRITALEIASLFSLFSPVEIP